MPRVLFVTSSFPRWTGDSTTPFVMHLAQDLTALGWSVRVLAPHADGAAGAETLEGIAVRRFRYFWPASGETVCYGGGALANLRRSPAGALKLPALIAAEWSATVRAGREADIVHSHWVVPQGAVVAATGAGRRHVATVHGSDVLALRAAPLERVKGWALRRAGAVTANSSATAAEIGRLTSGQVSADIVPMGVDRPHTDGDRVTAIRREHGRGGRLVVFVGRVTVEKGVGDLVEAFATLRAELPDVRLAIVGAGADSDHVRARIEQAQLADAVSMPGWVDARDVPNWFAAADVVAAPSWSEAQGLSVMEAQAVGAAVVATDVGGLPDVVSHGENGLLVPARQPPTLAAALTALLTDEPLRVRLGDEAARRAATRFDRAATARRFTEIYRRLLDEPAR